MFVLKKFTGFDPESGYTYESDVLADYLERESNFPWLLPFISAYALIPNIRIYDIVGTLDVQSVYGISPDKFLVDHRFLI